MTSFGKTCLLLLGLLLLGACGEAPQIHSMRVPKSESGIEDFRKSETSSPSAASAKRESFQPPEGWTRGKSNPMFPSDKFLKSFDDQEVVLSVTPLSASNGWVANASRWAGQISMNKSAEEIEAMSIELDVDEISSKKIRLFPGKEDSQAIIGIMTVKSNTAWFIKLMGNESAVVDAESEFDDYVNSLKIP